LGGWRCWIFAALVTVAAFSRQLVHGSLALPFGPSRPPRADGRASRPAGSLSPGPVAKASKRRRTVAARSNRQGQWRLRLRLSVLVELGLLAAVLAVTAGLVNAQPARSALTLPYSTEVHAGPNVLVDVIVDPAKPGPVALHIYTLTPDGARLDVPDVSAYFSLASAGIHDLPVPLEKAGPGPLPQCGVSGTPSWHLDAAGDGADHQHRRGLRRPDHCAHALMGAE
jgi:copper transport protein